MRIDRVELFHVAMPLISPWRTAYGEDSTIHSILCRISSGSLDAWGESTPLAAPCYSPEWAGGVFLVVRDWLAPALVGADVSTPQQLQDRLASFKGNAFGKAVLDSAWWGLWSAEQGVPLHVALGATRSEVAVGADFGVGDSLGSLLADVAAAAAAGFPRIKLKFRPGWDVAMLQAVRRELPEHTIHIDCNSGYSLADQPLFKSLDGFRLAMIEQPLAHDDLLDHAQLQAALETPLCLDESISSLRLAQQAVVLGSCQYINIKPGRVGGLTPAKAIHDFCQEAGVPCWVGGMLESATGASQCASLAMLDNFTYPADIFPSSRFYHEDLSDPPLELHDANGVPCIAAPERPSTPHPQRLKACTLQHAVIKA
jgi:O-succinylbenzoate synthase